MGADDFGGRVEEAVVADVEPEGAVIAGVVGEGRVACGSDFEYWGDVDAVNHGEALDVGGGGCFVAVAVSDGREEAELGKVLVEFSI